MDNYFVILPVSSAILCIGLGIFTFSRNPRHPANIGFAFGMLNLAVIEAGKCDINIFWWREACNCFGMQINLIGQGITACKLALLFSTTFARANYKEMLCKSGFQSL